MHVGIVMFQASQHAGAGGWPGGKHGIEQLLAHGHVPGAGGRRGVQRGERRPDYLTLMSGLGGASMPVPMWNREWGGLLYDDCSNETCLIARAPPIDLPKAQCSTACQLLRTLEFGTSAFTAPMALGAPDAVTDGKAAPPMNRFLIGNDRASAMGLSACV